MELTGGNETGFMDLPPEIRNHIYGLVLTTDKEIRVTRHNARPRNHPLLPGHRQGPMSYKVKGKTLVVVGVKKRKLLFVGEAHAIAILRVCKTINAEATPLFYGANQFSFMNSYALEDFRFKARNSFGFLKDIEIKSLTKVNNESLRIGLVGLSSPTRITLQIRDDWWAPLICDWLWTAIRTYVLNTAQQPNIGLSQFLSDDHKLLDKGTEPRKRFDQFVFAAPDGLHVENSFTAKRYADNEVHAVIHKRFLKRYAQHGRVKKLGKKAAPKSKQTKASEAD